jgi:large subunit ribosomal protein L30
MAENEMLAAVMVKGTVKIDSKTADTLKRLRLSGVNNCVIVPADETRKGMLKSVDRHVTWGEVSKDVLDRLVKKRGCVRKSDVSGHVFRLSPPTGGLKSVRLHYPGGSAGYRGRDINSLLMRMI